MPEGYTHVTTGEKALLKSGAFIFDRAAFCAGAQGPDPFFFYSIWQREIYPDIRALGSVMHNEKTGAFLCSLVKNAGTPTLKSYALGFLTHYATDKNAHPYVNALTTHEEAPYNIPQGHGFYEIALDSELHFLEYGTRLVPLSHSTPLPKKAELYDISLLLHIAIKEAYDEDISIYDIYKSFFDIRLVRAALRSRFGLMKRVYRMVEDKVLKNEGYILSHLTPSEPLKKLPPSWKNDFTGELTVGGIEECLKKAIAQGAEFIKAADDYWKKHITINDFLDIIKSRSYETDLDV